jgi:hypothetical protein
MSPNQLVSRLTESAARRLDRHRLLILTALTVGWFILLVLRARNRPLWHDEVYTVLVARLPFSKMWKAYLDAIDLSPPLNTMITRVIQLVFGEGPVVTRIPAMVGYVVTSLVLFAFVRRRSNVLMGLSAALLPITTVAWDYAREARGYGITMACFACALYGWSEAAAGRRPRAHLVLMSVALSAGMWTHFYFALAFLPISLGELTRQISLRRFDRRPWLALAAAAAAVIPLLPLAAVASAQTATFWARPKILEFESTYLFILGALAQGPLMKACAFAALFLTASCAVASHAFRIAAPRRLATHDMVACVLCLLVPAGAALLGFWAGAFAARYAIYSIVGLLAAMPLLLWSISPANRVVDLTVLLFTLLFGMSVAREVRDEPPWHDALSGRPILTDWFKTGQDVVVTGSVDYLPIWYYSPPDAQPHVKYLADPAAQLVTIGSDTVDLGYLALSRWLPVPVVPIARYVRTHEHFFLYSPGEADSWVERRLRSWNPMMSYHGRDAGGRLYEVQMPPK